jgi:hypothetical protein
MRLFKNTHAACRLQPSLALRHADAACLPRHGRARPGLLDLASLGTHACACLLPSSCFPNLTTADRALAADGSAIMIWIDFAGGRRPMNPSVLESDWSREKRALHCRLRFGLVSYDCERSERRGSQSGPCGLGLKFLEGVCGDFWATPRAMALVAQGPYPPLHAEVVEEEEEASAPLLVHPCSLLINRLKNNVR